MIGSMNTAKRLRHVSCGEKALLEEENWIDGELYNVRL